VQPLDVYTLARSGASRSGELPLARLPRLGASLVRHDGVLAYEARGLVDGQRRPGLRLQLQADLVLRCDRCGGELVYALAADRLFYFVDTEEQLAAIEIDDAPEEPLLGSVRFDLAGLIEDEAILQLPLSPRHERCTARRPAPASAPADAPSPQRPHPFAALGELRGRLGPAGAPPDGAATPSAGTPPKAKKHSGPRR